MKRVTLILLLMVLLAGCTMIPPEVSDLRVVTPPGEILEPLANSQPLYYQKMVPGKVVFLDFRPNRNQYNEPTGLTDSRYVVTDVVIQCAEKAGPDTVYEFITRERPNEFFWFPAWTGDIFEGNRLPVVYKPVDEEPAYWWDACRDAMGPFPAQTAKITATARARWVGVEFLLPDQGGHYTLEGELPTTSHVIRYDAHEPGTYVIEHSSGAVYEIEIPIDLFWIRGEWIVDVAPRGWCQ
jgi:hypothetical protein